MRTDIHTYIPTHIHTYLHAGLGWPHRRALHPRRHTHLQPTCRTLSPANQARCTRAQATSTRATLGTQLAPAAPQLGSFSTERAGRAEASCAARRTRHVRDHGAHRPASTLSANRDDPNSTRQRQSARLA